jgi:hypothetical protein
MVFLRWWLGFCFCVIASNVCGELHSIKFNLTAVNKFGNELNNKRRGAKLECKTLHQKYKVKPGSSWGDMNVEQQNKWMYLRCDAYFCKPDKLESKGVYKCVALKHNQSESRM